MTLKTFIGNGTQGLIYNIIQLAVDLMFAAAVFFFIWNVFLVITKSDQPEEVAKLKSKVAWGIVSIAIMASVWGLVALVLNSTGLNTTTPLIIKTGP